MVLCGFARLLANASSRHWRLLKDAVDSSVTTSVVDNFNEIAFKVMLRTDDDDDTKNVSLSIVNVVQ